MRFDVITLFPELFAPHLLHGVTRRAFEPRADGAPSVDVRLWPLRDYAEGNHRRVDDRPFGGGPGMVMLAEPLERALQAVRASRAEAVRAPVVLFTPTGRHIDQALVRRSRGRRRGAAVRALRRHRPALHRSPRRPRAEPRRLRAVGRRIAGAGPARCGGAAAARRARRRQSHQQDSFSDGLLDCPHYSRPEVLAMREGPCAVPPVLLSGHHAEIARWRRERSLELTARAAARPDRRRARRRSLSADDERCLATLQL